MGGGCAALLVMLLHSDDVDVAAAVQRGVLSSLGLGLEEAGEAEAVLDRVRETVRQSKCFAIAAPCLCTLQLATAAEEHVTTVVAGKDVVCRLSIANVQHLVTKLNAATPLQPVLRLVQQVLGGNGGRDGRDGRDGDRRAGDGSHAEGVPVAAQAPLPPPSPAASGDDHRDAETTAAVSSAIHNGARRPSRAEDVTTDAWADADADDEEGGESRDQTAPGFLVPPGRVIHLRHLTSSDGPPTAEFRHPTRFTEIAISIRLMADHMPKTYLSALDRLLAAPCQEEERALHTEVGTESPHLAAAGFAAAVPIPVERAEAQAPPDTQHMECSPPSSPSLPMVTTLYL